MANGDAVGSAMLEEAQSKVSSLMAELYGQRRELTLAQQALNQANAQKESLSGRVQELEQHVAQLQPAAARVPQLEAALQQANQRADALQSQVAALQEANKQLEAAALNQQVSRQKADDAKIWSEAERSKLQRSRDELAIRVRTLEQRLVEAEEEQQRVEHDLTVARQEMQILRRGDPSAVKEAAGLLEHEHELLEQERNRSAALLSALDAQQQLVQQLQQQLQGTSSEEMQGLREHCTMMEMRLAELAAGVGGMEAHFQSAANGVGTTDPQANPAALSPNVASAVGMSADTEGRSGNAAAVLQQEVQQLQSKVTKLKHSRDRLLAQLDEQAAELERLANNNAVLRKGLTTAEDTSQRFLRQLQTSLEHNERLKDLLEDSVVWSSATALSQSLPVTTEANGVAEEQGAHQQEVPAIPQHDEVVSSQKISTTGEAGASSSSLQLLLTQEQARVVDLDLQVRALCAELTRSTQASAAVSTNVLPLLANIEERLQSVAHLDVQQYLASVA